MAARNAPRCLRSGAQSGGVSDFADPMSEDRNDVVSTGCDVMDMADARCCSPCATRATVDSGMGKSGNGAGRAV